MKKKREVNKETKAYKNKVIKKLKNKLLKLWSIKIRERAGNKCEFDGCTTGNLLNAHHVENYITNPELRYDLKNGVCVCQSHHKFFAASAHKSFIFMYNLMNQKHPAELLYLLNFKPTGEELTVEKLEQKISEMEAIDYQKENKETNPSDPPVAP